MDQDQVRARLQAAARRTEFELSQIDHEEVARRILGRLGLVAGADPEGPIPPAVPDRNPEHGPMRAGPQQD